MIRSEADPFVLFGEWYREADEAEPSYANSMALATVREDGSPDVRIVLMKAWDHRGFVFYTNLQSAKGTQLARSGAVAANFHWKSLQRQVRLRGAVEPVSVEEADAYFASRPRVSRLGAWASPQSRPLGSRDELVGYLREVEARFPGEDVPRPPHWSGLRIVPNQIEFWSDGEFRLHDRRLYSRGKDGTWGTAILAP
ncbi:pyridoxamine 5'-phosphate oxidase [bacterium]|nr:pyridoxamine 5'-phosphate oxidase [bacterium]